MDQISLPFRIALVAMIVFAAAWMTVLRPHAAAESTGPAPSAAAPGVSGLERPVQKAKGASAASDAANARVRSAGPERPATTPAPAAAPAAAKPAAPGPVAAVAAKKPAPVPAPTPAPRAAKIVLLFAGAGADDAVARQVVRSIHRRGVRTIVASLAQLGRYRDLTGSLQIASAPTILVIGRDRKAQLIEGLPDISQVDAALAAAR